MRREGSSLARRRRDRFHGHSTMADGAAWETIVRVADDAHLRVIVTGTRRRTGLRSLVVGSVSHAVARRAHEPLLVVPSSLLAAARGDEARRCSA